MFRYRLAPLLRYRKNLEEQQQRALAETNRHYLAEIARVHELEGKRSDAMTWRTELYRVSPKSKYLKLYDYFMTGVNVDIAFAGKRTLAALQAVNAERAKLLELVKNRRTIELHRDRLKERYDLEEARKERAAADEMAITRFALKGGADE